MSYTIKEEHTGSFIAYMTTEHTTDQLGKAASLEEARNMFVPPCEELYARLLPNTHQAQRIDNY